MSRLEDLTKGALVRVVDLVWHGSSAATLTFTDVLTGRVDQELLDRQDEARLAVEQASRAWPMDADGNHFRLVSEAKPIALAYLFDPFLAVQTSNLDPLPHQIEARLRENAAASAPAVPAGRRSGRRQDDHGRAFLQGADDQGPTSSNGRTSSGTSPGGPSTSCPRT
jgi:hypothetical protein